MEEIMTKKTKVILITGCNSPTGIGFNTAHHLANKGYMVYATVRDETKDCELRKSIRKDEDIRVKYLELTDEQTLISVVHEILREQGKIDVLINNAGYGLIGAVETVSIEQAKREYDVNVFGTVRLIQEVLPHMREKRSGHIINVSSIFCAGASLKSAGFYVGTKAALEKISEALAFEVASYNIKITNFQPGPVRTNLSKEFGKRKVDDDIYDGIFEKVREHIANELSYESPEETAKAICRIVASKKPALFEQSNENAEQYVAKYKKDISGMKDGFDW